MKNNLKNFKSFFYSYVDILNEKINKLSLEDLFKAVKIIESTIKKKNIFMYVATEDLQQLQIIIFVIFLNNFQNIQI